MLALKRARPERYPFLLESTTRGANARYSILFAFPGETLALSSDFRLVGHTTRPDTNHDFLSALDHWWQAEYTVQEDLATPFRGGWFIYLGYELAAQIESLVLPPDKSPLPAAFATRIPAAIIFDHHKQCCIAVAEPGYPALLDALRADIARLPTPSARVGGTLIEKLAEDPPAHYLNAVIRARDYIGAGDVFQVNLARTWRAAVRAGVDANTLYARLREVNPAPFAGIAAWHGASVISSSPERLVRVCGERVETRPIAGTRPRHDDRAEDARAIRELLRHPKERAEHIMLIDLERNDLGRVARTGSVRVDELMVSESYAHVHHIVSGVSAALKPHTTPADVIRAVFPGGTITGCPKIRSMEIIAELEACRRGPYTGAMGYLNCDGDMDLNILIRTMVMDDAALEWRAGAGIVADSVPEQELEETRAKARGLLAALN